MFLGDRIKQARLAAGMSQRELCGDVITRNMLSLIENGTAMPSVSTLQFLAARLGYPVSYFLDEEGAASPNSSCVKAAWESFDKKEYAHTLLLLEKYKHPDPIFDREYTLLFALALLNRSEDLILEKKYPFARQLLLEAEKCKEAYMLIPELKNRLWLLKSRLEELTDASSFYGLDEMLLARAKYFLKNGNAERAMKELNAITIQDGPEYNYLRGKAAVELGEYQAAVANLKSAESAFPKEANAQLERCYRELGDYQNAYLCACKEREFTR